MIHSQKSDKILFTSVKDFNEQNFMPAIQYLKEVGQLSDDATAELVLAPTDSVADGVFYFKSEPDCILAMHERFIKNYFNGIGGRCDANNSIH